MQKKVAKSRREGITVDRPIIKQYYSSNGRTSKVVEKKKIVLELIKEGNYDNVACQAVGIPQATLCNWKSAGRDVEERLQAIGKLLNVGNIHSEQKAELVSERAYLNKNEYFKFFKELKKAVAEAEVSLVADVRKAGRDNNWGASMTMLERKFGERWGKHDRVTTEEIRTLDVNVSFKVQLQKLRELDLPDDKLQQIVEVFQLQDEPINAEFSAVE